MDHVWKSREALATSSGSHRPWLLGISLLPFLAGASFGEGPCDIYAAAGTPCVAAHSTTRALFAAYNGPLYQVRRVKTNATKDIPVLAAGGFVATSVQDQFCTDSCTISILYDQTSQKNHLVKSPKAAYLKNGGVEASAAEGLVQVGGRSAHGVSVTGRAVQWYEVDTFPAVAYRNNATKGIATGNQAESMYMVVDGTRFSAGCCFDYGNVETTGNDDGNGTMEAIYWGTNTSWGGKGDGTGPWVAADLENGMFKANRGGKGSDTMSFPNAKTISVQFASTFLKGPADSTFAIKAGDAQTGRLTTMWNGPRPSPSYSPKKLQGAVLLGTGGDGSRAGTGTFFEGAMTIGSPPDSIDDKIQANIVAAGYARQSAGIPSAPHLPARHRLHRTTASRLAIDYQLDSGGSIDLRISDLQGRIVGHRFLGWVERGFHSASFDISPLTGGIYIASLLHDGNLIWGDRFPLAP